MNTIELTCPNCGGTLRYIERSHRLVCEYCGVQHLLPQDKSTQTPDSAADKTVSDLEAEISTILMDIVLAVGDFTSQYPDWRVSQWIKAEKGENGELGAYRGLFLEKLTRMLFSEVNGKFSNPIQAQSIRDGEVLLEKLQDWQKEIADKKRIIQDAGNFFL